MERSGGPWLHHLEEMEHDQYSTQSRLRPPLTLIGSLSGLPSVVTVPYHQDQCPGADAYEVEVEAMGLSLPTV